MRYFLLFSTNMGRFPELTPVRSQAIESWLSTLEAGDITLLLEWTPTSTRELRRKEGGQSCLKSGNERQGTWSPLVVGRGAQWLGGVSRRCRWYVGSPRVGS